MIRIKHLSKTIQNQKILDDINLEIKEGELLVILGQSGAGKSVFLKHLIGLFKPDSGSVEIDAVDITNFSESELLKVRKNIGYLFQEGALYDFMDIYENIAFPLEEHTDLKSAEIDDKVRGILRLVGLEGAESKYPVELSGGMRKRAALARSVILNSKILLCDEPTSGLDPIRSRDISDLIKDISKKFHCTTVVTSHDVKNSFRIADRLAILDEGTIVALGTKDELQASRNPFVQEFLGLNVKSK